MMMVIAIKSCVIEKVYTKFMQKRTIGLIGGIGWASTHDYYRLLNEAVVACMGVEHSARIILTSMNQYDFAARVEQTVPQTIQQFIIQEGQRLKAAGADFFLICANGAHRFAADVVPEIGLPFVSIVDETAAHVQRSGIKKVGLLGVKPTMTGNFYHRTLADMGVETIVPEAADQDILHEIIYSELVHNRVEENSRKVFVDIINKLQQRGAEGVILGCTELPLIIRQSDVNIPIFNTTEIHCEAAIKFAFED
jgi:aspartate racemase